ncbi:hypothetical protein L9F63_023135, partial [Diploptera punctata]
VQEVIDALESQLDTKLEDSVKGVRAMNGNYFVCLNNEDNVNALLENGLNIQGEKLTLKDTSPPFVTLTASGVPYDVSDDQLTKALAQYGSVVGETCLKPEIPSKSLGNCFATDRYRSQISVRLKQPNPKSNRSLDNLLDTNTSNQLHNTSLPIISAFDNTSPVEPGNNAVTQAGISQTDTAENMSLQPFVTNVNKDLPIIYSDTPLQNPNLQTVQLHNTTDDSLTQQICSMRCNSKTTHSLEPTHQFGPSTNQQRHLFLPQATSNSRCYLSNSGLPSPALTPQNSPQINRIPNFSFDNPNYHPNAAIHGNNSSPGIFLPTPYFHGDIPQQSHISTSNSALNVPPPQPNPRINTMIQSTRQLMSRNIVHEHAILSGSARRKLSRKPSSANTSRCHQIAETSLGPSATSSPNTKHKSSVDHSRKTSGTVASNADTTGGGQTNVVDVSRSSSSGQDSPTKPDRRRRVSIYFNNKKGAKRRDSVFVPNGAGILTRSLSLDTSHRYGGSTTDVATGHSAGAETTTCSERERTNSGSSRTSSATATGRIRKQSENSNRGSSINDIGKVPWCGCWGNGCL